MTKLMEWVFGATVFLALWSSLLTGQVKNHFLEEYKDIVLYLPLIFIVLFGMYAASVVLWRVYTFNDCESAAKELQKQIKEAKEDLASKGFNFGTKAS